MDQHGDSYSTFLLIVKIVSFISAILFGVLGIIKDSKTKEGDVTKWGLIAVTGVVVSGLISGASLFAEERVKSTEKLKAETKNIEDQKQVNEDKDALNNKFKILIEQATTNINKTDEVAGSVQESVASQKKIVENLGGVIDRTTDISENVKKNIEGQNQVLVRTGKITQSLNNSSIHQQKLLAGNNKLLIGMESQLTSTSKIIGTQNELSKNLLRSLAPLKTMSIAYTIGLNLDDDDFTKYIDRLVDLAYKGNPPNPVSKIIETGTSLSPSGMTVETQYNKITRFHFDNSSGYFPSDKNNDGRSVIDLFEDLSSRFEFNFNRKQAFLEILKKTKAYRDSDLILAPSDNAKKILTVEFNGNDRNVYLSVFSPDLNWIQNYGTFVGLIDLPSGIISVRFPYYKGNPINVGWTMSSGKLPKADLTEVVIITDSKYGAKYCLSPDNMELIPFNTNSFFIYQMHDSDLNTSSCSDYSRISDPHRILRETGFLR